MPPDVLPHNLDAEAAVLGAILLDNSAMSAAAEILAADDFYGEAHGLIFAAMVGLSEANRAIDQVTVAESLTQGGKLERAGGMGYLSALMDGLPRALNVAEYGTIVMSKAAMRKLIASASTVIKSAMNGASELDEHVEKLSIHLREIVGLERIGRGLEWGTAADVITGERTDWVVPPFIATGAVTDLGGPPKGAGKTTLATHASRSVIFDEPFLGQPTKPGPVVYLTEETPATFAQALSRAGLIGCEDFHILYRKVCIGMAWPDVMAAAVLKAKGVGAVMLVVDTAPAFMDLAGEEENSSGAILQAMKPLQNAAGDGLAVLATRHERKSGGTVGTAGRGSSAYTGCADIVLALRRPPGGTRLGVRELHGLSRFDDTPSLVMVEFTKHGYVAHGSAAAVAVDDAKRALERTAPKNETEAKSLDELLSAAGEGISRPSMQRAADRLLEDGVLAKVGRGVRGDPFRFFLIKHLHIGDQKETALEPITTSDADEGGDSLRDGATGTGEPHRRAGIDWRQDLAARLHEIRGRDDSEELDI